MKPQPPRLEQKIFEWIAGPALVDDLLGDLDEWFYQNHKTKSLFRCRMLYWKQMLSLAFSYTLIKRRRDVSYGPHSKASFSPDMIQNYIKVAVRNLYRYRYFSVLNAFGLAVGMSVSLLLISLYSFVGTYDDFHENGDRIYTVTSLRTEGVEERDYAIAPAPLAGRIEEEFSGAEKVIRIARGLGESVGTDKENIPLNSYYTTSDFISAFSFSLVRGSTTLLDKPNQIILTVSAAKKLFGSEDPLSRILQMSDGTQLEVAGLMQDVPNNTHLSFEALISYSTLPESNRPEQEQWNDFPQQYIYVLLRKDIAVEELQDYLNRVSTTRYEQSTVKVQFSALALRDITMGPDLRNAIGVNWDASGILIFGVLAALILLPACFNYTNISIARSLKRAKEIGLRKTLGGVRSQIFFQFITETVIITLLSFLGALLIFVLIRSEFQSMLVSGSTLDLSITWKMLLLFGSFALLTGFVAGIFPALHFSGLNPIQALKSKIDTRGSSIAVRKVLTVFQLTLSLGFILSLMVFNRQYQYSLNFDFGFEKKNIVEVPLQDVDQTQFKTAFSGLASVQSIALSSGLPGVSYSNTWMHDGRDSTEVWQLFIDPNFIPAYGLSIIAGKNFPDETFQAERYLIVNEQFLKDNGIQTPAEALGRIYQVEGRDLEILGVVSDFHFAPLQFPIEKFFFRMNPSRFTYASLQVTTMDAYTMFSMMESTWKTLSPDRKFSGQYFEEELIDAYMTYLVLLRIVGFLGLLAITISLLGMLGMVVYTVESRTREAGIRKVMGASPLAIAVLLSADYLKMMSWAVLISVPVTIFLLNELLKNLQYYRIDPSIADVLLSVLVLFVMGIVTIASQTWKTARTNPVTVLRLE